MVDNKCLMTYLISDSVQRVVRVVDQVFEQHKNLNFFHIGADEVSPIFFFFFFFYVRAYLGINSMKLITNGKDHIVTADKYTPR